MCFPEGRFCSNFRNGLDVRLGEFRDLQALDFFATRLHLAGASASRETRNEFVELRNLFFPLGILPFDLRADLRLRHHHVVIVAGIRDDGLVIDVGNVGTNAVEKMAVVRDRDQDAVIVIQEPLQPVDRVEVEVVGRLIEQQCEGMSEQGLRQQHANFLAALQFAHFSVVQFVGNIEPLQQNRSIRFGGVAVLFANDAFQLAELHSVFIRKFRLGMNPIALFHRGPQALVAHHHGIDDTVGVKGKLVLAQHAELLRTHDGPLLGIEFAGQKPHKRRLARAVRSGKTIALARREGRGHFFKQNFGAVAHGNIAY